MAGMAGLRVISARQLGRTIAMVLDEVEELDDPFLITRNGVPVAWLSPVNRSALAVHLLNHAPDVVRLVHEAGDALASGGGRPGPAAFAEARRQRTPDPRTPNRGGTDAP